MKNICEKIKMLFAEDEAAKKAQAEKDANELFSIRRIDNADYVFFGDVCITIKSDGNVASELLDRLYCLKIAYINKRMKL